MNNILAPYYKKKYGDYWILWFNQSNTYSVIESSFKEAIDIYLETKNTDDFHTHFDTNSSEEFKIIENLNHNITRYLKQCNTTSQPSNDDSIQKDETKKIYTKTYVINNQNIQINFDSEVVLKMVHPSIAYLEAKVKANNVFDIYLKDNYLHLFKNDEFITRVPKLDYHKLQGKFIMHLICTIHNKVEKDWIGTFHGSTISDGKSAIMFVGLSGKGKSTLTSLLAANGLELVADDISPLLAKNLEIHTNPLAVSIKKGSFDILKPLIPNFENIDTVTFNTLKGGIKYVPFTKHTKLHYPCKSIVLVNYTKDADTNLKPVTIKEILEPLIPDSWLNHNAEYAKLFLDWLSTLQFYELTYSNSDEAIETVKNLFKQF